jgi:uncharacterized protein YdeI (YjbR/CyaY-like superfamily)
MQTIPTFFAKQSDFRRWLQKNHKKETELLVGFYKVGSGKPSMTWSQSVDEALCFGWIDGVRKSIDKESYQIRFTQRKPTSIWSANNIKKIEELKKQGLMRPAGLASFEQRTENKSRIYSYEKDEEKLPQNFKKQFKKQKGLGLLSVTGTFIQKGIDTLGNECKAGNNTTKTTKSTYLRKCGRNKPVERQ